MRNPMFRVLATLLGVLGALTAAVAAVLAAFWVMDQSGPTSGWRTFLAAVGLGIVAVASMLGRRALLLAAPGWRRTDSTERAG
jgi:hypothetical protein